MTVLIMAFSINVYAEENIIKISMDSNVKPAKEIGSGKGISFTLPDIESDDYFIDAIELAVFEKQYEEDDWHIYKDNNGNESKKQYIQSPESLNFNVDFGDLSVYRDKTKYKIAYRYYVRNIHDMSIFDIAGKEIKDGWRLVGEQQPQSASEKGFTFYKNTNPTMEITYLSYQYHTKEGIKVRDVSKEELLNTYLPMDAFETGVAILLNAQDFDKEDILTAYCRLEDVIKNEVIYDGPMPTDMKISTEHKTACFRLIVTVRDNFGGMVESEPMLILMDLEAAKVISEFDDGGFAIKGKNLFSDFKLTDDQNEAMTEGQVYADIYNRDKYIMSAELENRGNGVFRLDKSNMDDGEYTVFLSIYDKAGNESEHVFTQTLDNTGPILKFFTPEENEQATYYSQWMNISKNIVIDAKDEYSGIVKHTTYLDGGSNGTTVYDTALQQRMLISSITTKKTGKLTYSGYVYDNAKTCDKNLNMYKMSSSGNYTYYSKDVWLDKTPPVINIHHIDNEWQEAPYTIMAEYNDKESANGVNDASGVKDRLYAVSDSATLPTDWNIYTDSVVLETSGVYYIYFKCIDYAGNETVESCRVRINNRSEITGSVRPTDDYIHTIYYAETGFYVVKNTAYNTKYHFELEDADYDDIIKTKVKLVNRDNTSIYAQTQTESSPNGSVLRDIVFNMSYIDDDLKSLPDGVYDMYLTIEEIKNDGETVTTHDGVKGCELVIKRNAPPTPVINVESGKVNIDYPNEPLSGSLNTMTIKSHYKKQYKTVKDGESSSNAYKTYMGEFEADNFIVTAVYTDIAGNTSIATKRIYTDDSEQEEDNEDVLTDGNTISVEESRAANVYYIGIRREKQSGINVDIFDFIK